MGEILGEADSSIPLNGPRVVFGLGMGRYVDYADVDVQALNNWLISARGLSQEQISATTIIVRPPNSQEQRADWQGYYEYDTETIVVLGLQHPDAVVEHESAHQADARLRNSFFIQEVAKERERQRLMEKIEAIGMLGGMALSLIETCSICANVASDDLSATLVSGEVALVAVTMVFMGMLQPLSKLENWMSTLERRARRKPSVPHEPFITLRPQPRGHFWYYRPKRM